MSDQIVLTTISQWYEYVCDLLSIGNNIKLEDIANIENCYFIGGSAGIYKNGVGYLNGSTVQWQITVSTLNGRNEWLYFYDWEDNITGKYYVRLSNEAASSDYGGGLLLVFDSWNDAKASLSSASCIGF